LIVNESEDAFVKPALFSVGSSHLTIDEIIMRLNTLSSLTYHILAYLTSNGENKKILKLIIILTLS
jgi:hypothetical protein